MFDAAGNETAQLTEWTYLGLLYSGGEVNLDVNLTVPVELDNQYQDQIGYLDWEFMVEAMPAEPDDPVKPGDDSNKLIYFTLMLGSVIFLIILLAWRKKDKEKKQNAAQF
jgi:hypothetical protein